MISLRSTPPGGTTPYWLHGIAPVGDLSYSTVWGPTGAGFLTASWGMALPRGFTHPALRQGARVELCIFGSVIGTGVMAEPDRDEWKFTIDGLHRQAEYALALTTTPAPTTKPQIAVLRAVQRGALAWQEPDGSFPNDTQSEASEERFNFNTVAAVLNMWSETTGLRWYVDPAGQVSFLPDPSEVSWHLTPGVPAMATADDDYVSTQYVRYVSAMSGTPLEPTGWGMKSATDQAAADRWGPREAGEDITNLGLVSSGFAEDAVEALLKDGRARPAFTQALELSAQQITRPGGTPACLHLVRAGQRVKQLGVLASDGSLSTAGVEWVIGRTSWSESDKDSVTVEPVGLAARTARAHFDRLVKKAQKKLA